MSKVDRRQYSIHFGEGYLCVKTKPVQLLDFAHFLRKNGKRSQYMWLGLSILVYNNYVFKIESVRIAVGYYLPYLHLSYIGENECYTSMSTYTHCPDLSALLIAFDKYKIARYKLLPCAKSQLTPDPAEAKKLIRELPRYDAQGELFPIKPNYTKLYEEDYYYRKS